VSQYHDAVLLNKIASAGTELGNFYFIDYSKPAYVDDIKEALQASLGMAMEGGAAFQLQADKKDFSETKPLRKAEKDNEEDGEENKEIDPTVMRYTFSL
jgi:hypothetical protein